MSNFTTPLKAAGIPIYAVSTWLVSFGGDLRLLTVALQEYRLRISSKIKGRPGRGSTQSRRVALHGDFIVQGKLVWARMLNVLLISVYYLMS